MKRNKSALMVAPVALSALWLTGCGQQTAQNTGEPDATVTNSADNAAVTMGGANVPTTKLKLDRGAQFQSGGVMHAGWTLKIVDAKTSRPVTDFERVHERLMHLIVVSKDLTCFNHLHPQYKGDGVFTVETKLPGPGRGGYKFYADYTPKGGANEVQQQDVEGNGSASLTADKISNGWIVKNVVAGPEGELVATPQVQLKADAGPLFWNHGPRYQVALMPMPVKFIVGQEAMLHFQVRDAKGKPVKDLQPYLGGLGHCVVISSDTKTYLHTHPMENGMDMSGDDHSAHEGAATSGGPDVMFHVAFPEAGLYKVWAEFKHRDKIITAAYVVSVSDAPVGAAQGGMTEGHESH